MDVFVMTLVRATDSASPLERLVRWHLTECIESAHRVKILTWRRRD